jgi:hypothetical protein
VGQKFGKYELLSRLGGGGMAEVFRARLHGPEGFAKDLALKLILPHFSDDPEFRRMFIQEANLAACLDHVNIVRTYEFEQVEGRYCIAMELVDGRDLRQLLARANQLGRHLSPAEAVVIGVELCRGLAYAHGELTPGAPVIIHRDISPHNVILSRAGEVKLTDLGIARLASGGGSTMPGVVKGKVAYMSPEQATGLPLDPRTDLFSLGCVLWEMLTGQRLFAGPNDLAVLERLRSEPILPPSAHNRLVPARLDSLVLLALARDREQRVASASALGRELERVLRELPEFDRGGLLSGLVRELWPDAERRGGTDVMPLPLEALAPVAPERAPEAPGQVLPEDASTEVEAAVTEPASAPPAPGRGRRSRRLAWGLAVVVGLLAAGLAAWWGAFSGRGASEGAGEGPGRPPAPVGAAQVAAPAIDLAGLWRASQAGWLRSAPAAAPAAASPAGALAAAVRLSAGAGQPARIAAERRPATGRLDLNVIPWARVYLNRRLLGETPLQGLVLPVGEHLLRLENPMTGRTKQVRVRILANQTSKEIVELR